MKVIKTIKIVLLLASIILVWKGFLAIKYAHFVLILFAATDLHQTFLKRRTLHKLEEDIKKNIIEYNAQENNSTLFILQLVFFFMILGLTIAIFISSEIYHLMFSSWAILITILMSIINDIFDKKEGILRKHIN